MRHNCSLWSLNIPFNGYFVCIIINDLVVLLKTSTRCLTLDGTRLRTETVEAAIRTVTETETEGEDTGTEDHLPTPQAATEIETEGDGDTDRKEVMHAQGGMFVCIFSFFYSSLMLNLHFCILKIFIYLTTLSLTKISNICTLSKYVILFSCS